MNATLDTSGLRARAHTAQISTPPRYAHTLCSLLTELTKSTFPIIDSLTVPTRSTGSELTECSKRFFSSWISTQVSTWGGLLKAPYSCADYPLPKESSPERQEPTLRMAEQFHVKPCHLLSAAPYAIRNRTDATAIIRRHSPRGGVLRRAAYEPTCSRPEHRPYVACHRPSQVCWFPQSPLPCFT